ncbi:MAG TPA: hypothetical protein VD907_00900 [Verrucomicrobiae bacterium]|nr:hypothetical protein [Verrucomicrobiae bacterium]
MNKWFALLFLVLIVLSGVAFILPATPGVEATSERVNLAICLLIFFTQAAATLFFLSSLPAFKKHLRRAYGLLASGIFLLGLVQLQLPISNFIFIDPIVLSWTVVLLSFMSSTVMYYSAKRFAKQLAFSSLWTNALVVAVLAAILFFATSLLPHDELGIEEWIVDGVFGLFAGSGVFALASALVMLKLRHRINPRYFTPITWLSFAFIAVAVAGVHEPIVRLLPYFSQEQFLDYFLYGFALWPLLLASSLFLYASMAFARLRKPSPLFPEHATPVQVVETVAAMVSDSRAIQPIIDRLREIDNVRAYALSDQERIALKDIYLQLEIYLTTEEPIRKLNREALRESLPDDFRSAFKL